MPEDEWWELAAMALVPIFIGIGVACVLYGIFQIAAPGRFQKETPEIQAPLRHGHIMAEMDGGNHCPVRAWASASGGGGGFWAELDSGAGYALWLTRDDADRIGIDVGSLDFNDGYRGISGPGSAADVIVPRLRIGGVILANVPARVISESNGTNTSLVGLPVLRWLNFRVAGNSCILSW